MNVHRKIMGDCPAGTAPLGKPEPVPVSALRASVDYRGEWPLGLFSPATEGHSARSALATSLALLRLCADEIEQRGGRATVIRNHVAECEPLV